MRERFMAKKGNLWKYLLVEEEEVACRRSHPRPVWPRGLLTSRGSPSGSGISLSLIPSISGAYQGGCSISTVHAETRSRFRLITSFYASRKTRFLDIASHASKRAPATRNREIED
jgi:hypothetical protein